MNAERLAAAVADVRAELASRYPVPVDTTQWRWDGGVQVDGGVLVAAQANAYVQGVTAALGVDVPRPAVLSDVDSAWTLHRWVRVEPDVVVDVHRSDDSDDLQTQWSGPTWLRAFVERGPRTLVQLPDGTVGWVRSKALHDDSPDDDPWARWLRAPKNEALQAGDLEAAAALARARLGRPYRWGGNTDEAADCSGFVQAVVCQAASVLLPKNTKDQRRCGERVAKGAIDAGDLIFVRGKNSRLSHVGLALPSPDGTTVIHSCLSRKRILEEPLTDFLKRYDFLGARRPVLWR